MYRYETHLHTWPVSKCGGQSPREALALYRALGYDGVFVTNHFLDGNANIKPEWSYEEAIRFYFSDYEKALALAPEFGLKVFPGVELSYGGTDFLVYGLDKAWYLDHPEIMKMEKSKELPFLMEHGALVVHAHPYREANYIDHIRLYPRCVQGVEVINANRTALENRMAEAYADAYGLVKTYGSDNHTLRNQKTLAGMEWDTPLTSVADFMSRVLAGDTHGFTLTIPAEAKERAAADGAEPEA